MKGKKDLSAILAAGGILILTFIVLRQTCFNGMLRWDDFDYVSLNPELTPFGIANVVHFFTSFHMGNYHPLTMLTFMTDYALFGLDPVGYHTVNLFLHLANTLLVFLFIYRLTGKRMLIAAFVSLFFGIHPMHVEPVAWISSRKDLLYTLFYLLSLISYLTYSRKKKIPFLALCFLFFILSLLSKGQAITLPLVLLVIDYFNGEKLREIRWLEKLPFIILSVLFGILAFAAQRSQHAVAEMDIPYYQRILFASYGLMVYTVKSIVPVNLCGFYQYIFTGEGKLPLVVIFSPLFHILAAIIVYRYFRHNRQVMTGLLFYLVTLSMVLQLLPIGKAVVAERYTYIPYIGLGFALADLFNRKWLLRGNKKYIVYFAASCLLVIFSMRSYSRVRVWKNDITFWTDVVKRDPMLCMAYLNRAMSYFFDERQYDSAISDCRKVMKIEANNKESYRHAGFFSYMSNQPGLAIFYLNKGLEIDTGDCEMLLFRANSYRNLNKYMAALADYDAVVRNFMECKASDKQFMIKRRICIDAWFHRGIMYCDFMGEYLKGIQDFNRVIAMDPVYKNATFNLCTAYYNSGDWEKAIHYASLVIESSDTANLAPAYFIRGMSFLKNGDYEKSVSDINNSKQLGYGQPAQ